VSPARLRRVPGVYAPKGCSSQLPGVCKLAALKQCKLLFGSCCGARLRANGVCLETFLRHEGPFGQAAFLPLLIRPTAQPLNHQPLSSRCGARLRANGVCPETFLRHEGPCGRQCFCLTQPLTHPTTQPPASKQPLRFPAACQWEPALPLNPT
jgi:hypothetical protein